jgi:hypothetical protein
MKRKFLYLILIFTQLVSILPAKAESQAACAIWLCLPGGFPTGCSAAYSEFKYRIKKRKPPLPSLSSCMVSPDSNQIIGSYDTGVEYFLPCRDSFHYSRVPQGPYDEIKCLPSNPQCNVRQKYRTDKTIDCSSYSAERRLKPNFIKLWVDGEYLGQFFYQ